MSGRKKHRRHQHGQPPSELLRELNSLRELLGSDMEADIPLLDQVADASGDQTVHSKKQHASPQHTPDYAPKQPQRPLTEMDLPILFSPVDEEPLEDFDDYPSALSDADRELLRPLQDLPRPEPERKQPQPPRVDSNRQPASQPTPRDVAPPRNAQQSAHQPETSPDEFQPGLFELEPESPPAPAVTGPTPPAPEVKSVPQVTAKPAAPQSPGASTSPMTENPFLPPHIRARLTGGRIPRPESIPALAASAGSTEQRKPEAAPASSHTSNHKLSDDERERLIDQLVAEQLPELERQLRLGMTLMLDELYPKKS